MAFRTVVISNRCKLEYSLNYLICRKDYEEKKILLDEIKILIIDSLQVSITTSLISMLIEKKIKVIFVDSKHNPSGEIVPYHNNYYSYRRIKEQISFSVDIMNHLWKMIIKEKIENQARNLKISNHEDAYLKLEQYKEEVTEGDLSNREGHSAKVYFNSLFGKDFNRDQDNNINKYLNYGYSILLSSINREIKVLGYLTELGIHHIGESNSFNLSCDFIEPLRPLIDYYVITNKVDEDNYKDELVSILSRKVTYNEKEFFLDAALRLYIEDMFQFLRTGDYEKIKFIKYEF